MWWRLRSMQCMACEWRAVWWTPHALVSVHRWPTWSWPVLWWTGFVRNKRIIGGGKRPIIRRASSSATLPGHPPHLTLPGVYGDDAGLIIVRLLLTTHERQRLQCRWWRPTYWTGKERRKEGETKMSVSRLCLCVCEFLPVGLCLPVCLSICLYVCLSASVDFRSLAYPWAVRHNQVIGPISQT